MKSVLKFSTLLLLMVVLSSCAINQHFTPVSYYIMDYTASTEKPELKQDKPFPYSLQINETTIPHTYNRNQIVVKYSLNRVSFLPYDQWASKLYETITNLVQQRIISYNIFTRADQNYAGDKSTYEMDIIVRNIERLDYGTQPMAHLAIDFNLRAGGNQDIIFTHHADIEKTLWDKNMDSFVIEINNILMEETDAFSEQIIYFLKNGKPETEKNLSKTAPSDSLVPYPADIVGDTEGELYLPSLTDSDTEPLYTVFDANGSEVATGIMGQALAIPSGTYKIEYGTELSMTKEVTIQPNLRTTVTPVWGAMIVNIIDESRNPVKIRYEVFSEDKYNVVSYGNDYSRIEELGEKPLTWLLPPGQYKITLNGQTYNTYIDFTTVNIQAAEIYRLTVVVDLNMHMVGAGIIRAEDALATATGLKFSNSINGIINLTSNNTTNKKHPEQSISLSGQFDNRLNYDVFPHHYTTKSLYEVELTKLPGTNFTDYRVTIDEYSIRNTYIYYFMKQIGFYTRADATLHFFQGHVNFDNPKNVIKYDANGAVVDTLFNVSQVQVSPYLLPLNLREGVGINYRMLQSLTANLNIRGGFGMQQEFSKNVYNYISTISLPNSSQGPADFDQYKEVKSSYPRGIETSIISSFLLPFLNMGITSTADFLFPLQKGQSMTMDIENIITVNLVRNVSLDIRLDLSYDKRLQNYVIQDYRTYLRVSWFY
jgi:ABC-type uncharacterized transport system auxiliary subunit